MVWVVSGIIIQGVTKQTGKIDPDIERVEIYSTRVCFVRNHAYTAQEVEKCVYSERSRDTYFSPKLACQKKVLNLYERMGILRMTLTSEKKPENLDNFYVLSLSQYPTQRHKWPELPPSSKKIQADYFTPFSVMIDVFVFYAHLVNGSGKLMWMKRPLCRNRDLKDSRNKHDEATNTTIHLS
jgi:hypothetical protein